MEVTACMNDIRDILFRLYGEREGGAALERIAAMLDRHGSDLPAPPSRFSQSDAILITYGDTLLQADQAPLKTLYDFACSYLRDCFSGIHLLPFFPFSSDDGFSVVDFHAVNSDLGTWEDVSRFGQVFDLMFDYVLNHISAKSRWFSGYLEGLSEYRHLAIEADPGSDLSRVTRPRTLPLLTPFKKKSGETVQLWTTFSPDQIDLNYKSIDVLCQMIGVLLDYIDKGARWIRMDAVAYLWKQTGTSCIHLPQTHDIIRLLRRILDVVAPDAVIITETNVPHAENIKYFGNGSDQAQMVYNFTLPPLLLHSLTVGDSRILTRWAGGLSAPSDETTFFNFTASHDGIGVRPLEGILPRPEIETLVQLTQRNGGAVSFKHNSDGSQSPYELNITYLDALGGHPLRFLASQAIPMVLPGVPAVYIHSLLGSRNWTAGVARTGRARTINRERLKLELLLDELVPATGFRGMIFNTYRRMLEIRRLQPAFHPNAPCEILELGQCVFGVRRSTSEQCICALTNMTGESVVVDLSECADGDGVSAKDLLTGSSAALSAVPLSPYQNCWLQL